MGEILKGQVGEFAEHAITNIRNEQGEMATGDVLRRTCKLYGEGACKQVCQLKQELDMFDDNPTARELVIDAKYDKSCSDLNLKDAISELGLEPSDVLMVGVTANEVGFAENIEEYGTKENPYGWKELPGFNAFFAREGEFDALGRRLADCGDVNFEFKDSDDNTVIGFEHGTRTNMFGSSQYPFELNGKKVSFTEYALGSAIKHYGADPGTVKIKLAAAIKGHNFTKHFDSAEKMEGHLPGWYEDGFVKNIDNPDWQEGDPVLEADTWEADTRGMLIRDIKAAMTSLGVPPENFNMEGIIDPGDSAGVFSSHQFSEQYGDTRDLYITYLPKEL